MLVLCPVVGWFALNGAPGLSPSPPQPAPANLGCLAQIGDLVWNDLDKDSLQGADEPGIPGVRVVLLTAGGAEITDQITDADGRYCFDELCAGTYVVAVDETTLPDGFMPAMPDQGDDAIDSDPNPTTVVLPDNYAINKDVDFGYCEGLSCRLTGGQNPRCDEDGFGNGWSTGGQIGAPTATQPQPCGSWTHSQNRGPFGKFTFHAGTASAPEGTEIDFVACSDPGNCNQSNAPAPAKQINFRGVGTFKNIQSGPLGMNDGIRTQRDGGATLHWFDAYVFDGGEPSSRTPGPQCDADGFEGRTALCECPDYYRFQIHQTSDPASPVIYSVQGYLDGGNYQMHNPTNGSTCR